MRAFSGAGKKRVEESRVAELERKVGQQAMEIEFLGTSLAACRGAAPAAGTDQRRAFHGQIEEEVKIGTRLSVIRMCEVAGFNRAGYDRFLGPAKPAPADMDLHHEMQQIALEWPGYGNRRITREMKARGWDVNRKRVQRLMQEDNRLCVAQRKFVVTTDSAHGLKVYPNRAASMVLTGVDQLWVADIYVHPTGRGVRLPGGDSGCVLEARDRMASGRWVGTPAAITRTY